MTESYVNRTIQRGIYYFELSKESKKRPYLVVSDDQGGYGAEILAFSISEQFTSSEVCLPIVINGYISFIRTSSTIEVPKNKIKKAFFDGLLREDIFNIAIRMFTKRFEFVDQDQLKRDTDCYVKELEKGNLRLYVNKGIHFKKSAFYDQSLKKYKRQQDSQKKKGKQTNESIIEEALIKRLTLNSIRLFYNDMRNNENDKELSRRYGLNKEELLYLKRNIDSIMNKKVNLQKNKKANHRRRRR